MVKIRYAEKESYYTVRLSGLNDDIITGKFDTGAVATIITSKKLGLSDKQVEILKDYFQRLGVEAEDLILDNSLDKALLGDDFISCCTFSHQPKRDIIITTIDMDMYSASYGGKTDCVDIAEIV